MQLVGYARVSTPDQSLDRQLDELRAHGCYRVFAEAASGKRGAHRPQWDVCLAHLRIGDVLVVVELSRLGRNTGDPGSAVLQRALPNTYWDNQGLKMLYPTWQRFRSA
jgi:DNA invertase Pin-like site-specific DNA recombinase